MSDMGAQVKKLDLKIGEVVDIEGRRYDLVSPRRSGGQSPARVTSSMAK